MIIHDMLFTPESIIKARHDLLEQMEAGTLTREQTFQRALELDEFDATALTVLSEEREKAGDLAAAAEYCWRAGSADPTFSEPWFRLHASLPHASEAFRNGLFELGAVKTLRSPINLAAFKEAAKNNPKAAILPEPEKSLDVVAALLNAKRRDEPEEVSDRLRPYRLIDEVLDADSETGEWLDEELVDEILEEGARCVPLLIGILRAMATGSLPEENPAPIVCSLALLGEIGDPAVLPEIIECVSVDDEDIQEAARWALLRISSGKPQESFDIVRKLAPGADAATRSVLTLAVAHIPALPGKPEFLASLLDDIGTFSKDDRQTLFLSVADALLISEGARGREMALSLFNRHATWLTKRTKSEFRDTEQAARELVQAGHRIEPETGGATVYDICCGEESDEDEEDDEEDDDGPFDEDEEDEIPPEPVRRSTNRGRNDPCWCGSGKKYKKCHLESDEKARQASAGPENPPAGKGEEGALRMRLNEFVTDALGKKGMENALVVFLGSELPAGVDDNSLMIESLAWLMHDYVPPQLGRPLIAEFQRRNPGRFSAHQRTILESWSRSRYSLFEFLEVQPGSGVQVKDSLAGGEFFVYDVSTSKWAAPGDYGLARVEELDGRHQFTGIVLAVPAVAVEPLKEWALDAQRRSGLEWDAFLRSNSHRMRQEFSRLIKLGDYPKKVVSIEGDELVFSKARYKILDEAALRDTLDRSKEFVRHPDTGDYDWLEEEHVLGHIAIEDGRLTLECTTRQRLQRGKELLRKLAGEHLRHRDDHFTAWTAALRDDR